MEVNPLKNPGIYILTSPSGKQYVGRDINLPSRTKEHLSGRTPECKSVHKAIKRYGADAFDVEIIQYPGISHEALNAVERWWIRRLQTVSPSGYNLTEGGEGVIPSEETRRKMSESNQKRVEDGTHPFLGGEVQRRNARKQVEDGTHNFLGGEVQRRSHKKRVENGTHQFLGARNPSRKRITNGTHHFLKSEVQRHINKKRVANGTHNFLKSDVQQRAKMKRDAVNKKRLKDGTHQFIGDNNPMKRLAKEGRHPRTLKRQKAEWCYIIALSRFWYEIHDYTLKRRAEFLSKDIPDTSNAEQEYLL